MQLLFDNSDEHVGGHGTPDLRLHRVLAGAQETLDAQMLLDPFEEQFDLPSALVQRRDHWRGQAGVAGQEHQSLARVGFFEADAAQVLRIVFVRVMPVQGDSLIADDAHGFVHSSRVNPPGVHVAFGAGDKEGPALMQGKQSSKVDIAPVHDVESACLDGQHIQHLHIVHLAIADVNKGGDSSAQIQQSVQLDRRLGRAKWSPAEQAQAKIDGGGVQGVDRSIELDGDRFFGIQAPGTFDQTHGPGLINAPIAQIQGIGPGRTRWTLGYAHVKQLGAIGSKASFDIAQRLAPGQLSKGHDAKQLGATQGTHSRIALVALDDAAKSLPRHKFHDLCKQCLARIHQHLRVVQTRKHGKRAKQNSNRGHA